MQTTSRVAFLLASTALVATALAPSDSRAQSAQINVSAFVEEACTIETNPIPINFDTYIDEQITRNPEFGWDCPPDKDLTFTLDGAEFNGDGTRNLPNIDVPTSNPLVYQLNDPLGFPWSNSYEVTSVGGPETQSFQAILLAGQLSDVSPGNFSETLTLNMTVE